MKETPGSQGQSLKNKYLLKEQMLSAIPLACYLLDKEGRIAGLNTLMESALQRSKKELTGKLVREVFGDAVPALYYDTLNQAMSLKKDVSCDYYSPVLKESVILTAAPFDEGTLVSFKAAGPSEDKYAVFEIEKQRFNEAQAIAKLGNYHYDVATDQVIWSNQTYSIMEIPVGEPVNFEKAIAVYKPSDVERLAELTNEALTHGTSFEMDAIIHVGPEKKEKYIYLQSSPVRDVKGEITGVAGVVQDISAIKHAEQRMLEDAAMIKGIADAAPDMFYVIDITQMKMIYANNNVLRLFGKTLRELGELGPLLFDVVVYPDDRPDFDAHIASLLAAEPGQIRELTFRLVDAQGKPRWVRTRRTVYRRDVDGAPTHVVSISQDVSEQMRLQEENRMLEAQRKEMESKLQQQIFQVTINTQEQERKRIAESIHNGLGQILYGVKLSLSRIRMNEHIQENVDCMEVLEETGKLLAEAIRESRQISHELTPTILENFGLTAAIEEISTRFKNTVLFKCKFSGMATRLETYREIAVYRIVQELMLNTVRHAKASLAEVRLKNTGKEIQIKVKDNGIGFDSADSKKTGIGLSNIKNKVSAMNGKMKIHSEAGQGTVIFVSLPRQ